MSGTTKPHRLEENIGGAIVELSADGLKQTQDTASKITITGDRYSASMQKTINR